MTPQNHSDYSDLEFVTAFESATMDPSVFTHQAHLRLAWLYIQQYGVLIAIEKVQQQIYNFVSSIDAQDKYHQTLTVAGVRAVHHFSRRSKANSFPEFIQENTLLVSDFKELIQSHYSYDVFSSDAAKKEYVAPDLQPFLD